MLTSRSTLWQRVQAMREGVIDGVLFVVLVLLVAMLADRWRP